MTTYLLVCKLTLVQEGKERWERQAPPDWWVAGLISKGIYKVCARAVGRVNLCTLWLKS